MRTEKRFSIRSRYKSFHFAVNGLCKAFYTEHNLRIHAVAAILILIAAICIRVSKVEFAILNVAIGLVLMAELFNTAIERMADFVSPEKKQAIGEIKDIAAAAVLIAVIAAVGAGCIIFIPKLLSHVFF